MNLDLSGKYALVSGSTQGIGLASAIELALLGANVTLIARSEDKLKNALSQLDTSKNQKHDYICADFTDIDGLKSKVDSHLSTIKTVNILVNNTGGPKGGPITEAALDEFTQTFSNHLLCNQLLAQSCLPYMKEAKYGRIINIISTSVKAPLKGLGVSNTVRGAVGNWAKTWAGEVGIHNITVNNVLPGATNTVRLKQIIEAKAEKTGQDFNTLLKGMEAQVPMNRIAEPEEVANAVAFLASPAAAYINGINIPVDGGRTPNL